VHSTYLSDLWRSVSTMKQKFVVTIGMTINSDTPKKKKDIKALIKNNLTENDYLTKVTIRTVDFD
jgi:hypothetical protein